MFSQNWTLLYFLVHRGKGYYDKYLLQANHVGPSPETIALAFKEQILPDIPMTENDMLISRVLTADWSK